MRKVIFFGTLVDAYPRCSYEASAARGLRAWLPLALRCAFIARHQSSSYNWRRWLPQACPCLSCNLLPPAPAPAPPRLETPRRCRWRRWLPRARRWLPQACPCLETTRRCRWRRWLPRGCDSEYNSKSSNSYYWRRWLPQACPCLAGDAEALPLAPLAAAGTPLAAAGVPVSGDAEAQLAGAGVPVSGDAQALPSAPLAAAGAPLAAAEAPPEPHVTIMPPLPPALPSWRQANSESQRSSMNVLSSPGVSSLLSFS